MNGVHDMGGMHGFGPVEPEPNEPVFHAPWEGRAFALNRAMGFTGLWNIDMSRDSRERLPPHVYLASSYYQKWTLGLQKLLVERGLVEPDELAAGRALRPGKKLPRKLTAAELDKALARGSFERRAAAAAKFKAGERVRARNMNPPTHTRLPRYARGRVGVVEQVRGCQVYPDSVVRGEGENPQWLYTVVFDGQELWGKDSDPNLKVSVEAFEPYLEKA
jgi:nitrile hydratase subunit beta